MDRKLLRTLARCRRVLCEIYALPEGTIPPELDDAVEELLMPGYRERLLAAHLASVPDEGRPAVLSRHLGTDAGGAGHAAKKAS